MAKGRAEGRAEQNSENARRMKALGVDTNVIREVTGLTAEEIGAL